MSTQTEQGLLAVSSPVDWAPVPRVNLLPPEVRHARKLATAKRHMAAVLLVVVGLGALGTYWAQNEVSDMEQTLSETEARTATLTAAQARYSMVPKVLAQVDAAAGARQLALAQDIYWYRFLDSVALITPDEISLTNIEITVGKSTGATTADPLLPTGIGQVDFSGKAKSFTNIATWLDSVADLPGVDGSSLKTATRPTSGDSTELKFTTSAVIMNSALSHRYDQKGR